VSQPGVDRSLVARSWAHAHEEDDGPDRVYRPAEREFPPSRGRGVVTLHADGSLLLGRPGPDDRGSAAAGHWSLDGTRLTLSPATGAAEAFEVETAEADRLVLRPVD
jgi:hypothetical protein